jgi:predicted nucleic acid-binding protein
MMPPLLIADTGPLIALSKIKQLGLLSALCTDIVVTPEVRDELLFDEDKAAFKGQSQIAQALSSWLKVEAVDASQFQASNPNLDLGEITCLCLGEAWRSAGKNFVLLIDDAAARDEARDRKLPYLGLAGFLLQAKRRGHLSIDLLALLHELRQNDYYLSDKLLATIKARLAEDNRQSLLSGKN